MINNKDLTHFDIIVVGAGHAGCEAALSASRLKNRVLLFTISVDSIAMMPCNPNIGGTSKGHLVREIDALGGEMGKNIDATFIQSKMLNISKGPAVHSLRAQADKQGYSNRMRNIIENDKGITIKQAEVASLIIEEGRVVGVTTNFNNSFYAKCVIICSGTYLKSRCIIGETEIHSGPNGLLSAVYLSDSLTENNIALRRFKTGTPARIDKNTIDFSKMSIQFGDEKIVPFSFETNADDIQKEQIPCYLTYTNEKTHRIIRDNIDRAPLFSGNIKGTGPRYCPSIEDKVIRFADKNRHQVFVEPEGLYTNEMYIDGMSTSLPEDVQIEMYRSVEGLENAEVVRNGYAIEYDCIDSSELLPSLESKKVDSLFFAGQINGSSGYEEAAAQGLIAGINADRKIKNKKALILDRASAYIGVLIDDLVSKEITEPYRMMTSRAEYRLLLRQDNADERLTDIGHDIGLISDERYEKFLEKMRQIDDEIKRVKTVYVAPDDKVNNLLISLKSSPIENGTGLCDLIKRPEINYQDLAEIDTDRKVLPTDVSEQVNIRIKYEGYIDRQKKQVEHFKKLENKKLSDSIDYEKIKGLSNEGRINLIKYKPVSIGQASRIAGVSPADISVLLVALGIR